MRLRVSSLCSSSKQMLSSHTSWWKAEPYSLALSSTLTQATQSSFLLSQMTSKVFANWHLKLMQIHNQVQGSVLRLNLENIHLNFSIINEELFLPFKGTNWSCKKSKWKSYPWLLSAWFGDFEMGRRERRREMKRESQCTTHRSF